MTTSERADTAPDEQDAEATALGYYAAVADGDGEKACSLMTAKAQAQMDAEFAQSAPEYAGKPCSAVLGVGCLTPGRNR